MHIVELSTAVIKVDIKVVNASSTQNQCLQCVTPSLMHVEIPRPRDATELNNDGIIKLFDVYYQTEPILSISSKEISSATTLVSIQVFFQQLTCNVMFFLSKSFFLNARVCL